MLVLNVHTCTHTLTHACTDTHTHTHILREHKKKLAVTEKKLNALQRKQKVTYIAATTSRYIICM